MRQVDWVASVPTLRRTAEWVSVNRQVGAMILVGSKVVALLDGLNTLITAQDTPRTRVILHALLTPSTRREPSP